MIKKYRIKRSISTLRHKVKSEFKPPDQNIVKKVKQMRVLFWNMRNFSSNKEFLADLVNKHQVDTSCLVETHTNYNLGIYQ